MRKKIHVWVFFIFVLFLAGCSTAADSVSNQGKIVVELFNQKPEITEPLENLAAAYEAEHPNTDLIITTIGSGEGAAGLQAKFTSGNPPALMMLGGTAEIDRYSRVLSNLEDMDIVDTMLPQLLEGGQMEDQLLALPMNIEGFGYMYNKEIFEQAGIDSESITDYASFVEAVELLDQKKEELGIDEVFAFSAGEDYIINQFSVHFTSPEFDHSMMDAYLSKDLDWEYDQQMKKYTDLMNQYNVQPILNVNYSQSVEELFVNDKVAMVHQGNWIVPTLNGIDPDFVQDKLGILPVFGENDETGRIVAGAPWYWGINKEMPEETMNEAENFLTFMYTSDIGRDIIVEEMNMIPPQAGYDIESITDPVSKVIYQQMLDGETSAMMHKQYPNGWMQLILYPEYQRYLEGLSTWEDFEENTANSWEELRY